MSGIALDEISSNLQEFQGEKANFKKVFWSSKSGFWEFSVLALCPSLLDKGVPSLIHIIIMKSDHQKKKQNYIPGVIKKRQNYMFWEFYQ